MDFRISNDVRWEAIPRVDNTAWEEMFGYVWFCERNDEAKRVATWSVVGRKCEKSADSRQLLPWIILKQVIRSNWSRRCSRDCRFRMFNRSAYERLDRPGKRLVNFLWIASIVWMRFNWEGFHMGEAYSRRGLTYVLNARIRLFVFLDRNDRWINAARWLAFLTISEIWTLNLSWGSTKMPKSFIVVGELRADLPNVNGWWG